MNISSVKRFGVILLSFSALALNAKAQESLPVLYNKNHHIVVIAHRGDHVNVPENTIAAYKQAIARGADYVEVDLRTTKDGHLVIMHNATVAEMTNGKGAVKDLTYKQIEDLKIDGKKQWDKNIYRIPDFESVLKACKGHINIYLDFKDANVAQTYGLIKKAGMQNHIAVYLNKKGQYNEWKKIAPKIPLIASLPENMDLQQIDSLLNKKKINIVDNVYDPKIIKFLHRKGITVWLDAESDDEKPVVWQKILNMGSDGLQADHPEKLIQYLKEKRLR